MLVLRLNNSATPLTQTPKVKKACLLFQFSEAKMLSFFDALISKYDGGQVFYLSVGHEEMVKHRNSFFPYIELSSARLKWARPDVSIKYIK